MGIRKNFGYNLILSLCNYIYPLITFPYVSHVFGADKIGVCGFVDGIVDYFVLFSMLGIGSYGVREIARCGGDEKRRNAVFTNLFMVNVLLTFAAVAVLILSIVYIPQLAEYREFLGVGAVKILFNLFLIEWFFQGIEQFKYITMRSIVVRTLYVVAVLVLIKSPDDLLLYYMLTTGVVVVNSLFNWNYSRRFRRFDFSAFRPAAYLLPILAFGYYRLLTAMYTTFNAIFLRAVTNDTEVGYFTTASKLYSILMAVMAAFTTIMIPRVSAMLVSGETGRLQRIADNTFGMLFTLALPVIIFSLFFAPQIIFIIAGQGFEGAVVPFRIVIVLLLIIGMEQIVIQQFLMASVSNRSVVAVSTVGAVVGLTVNFSLTPSMGAVGAALAWAFSELAVLAVGIRLMRRHTGVAVCFSALADAFLWSVPYALLDALLFVILPQGVVLWVAAVGNALLFAVINLRLHKNTLIVEALGSILNKFSNR